jgi:hypothetical protein
VLLFAAALGAGCSGGDDSLRNGLEGLPRDTATVAAADSMPDSAPALEGPSALPDTAGLPYVPPGDLAAPAPEQPTVSPQDTLRPTPGTPRDTRPSIPREGVTLPPPDEWTAGVTTADRGGEPAIASAIRVGRGADYDRVVFEFRGAPVPGYHVEYVDRPVRQCGSGEPVRVAGDGWLEVRLTPARAHDEDGEPTVMQRSSLHPDLPLVREIRLTCDFEGHVTWVLGVAHPNRYRVLTLSNPARLVVDVRRR